MNNVLLKNNRGNSFPIFSKKEEREIFQKLEKEPWNLKIRNEIILRNMGLVGSIVNRVMIKYKIGTLSFSDLQQTGVMGLIKAIERFKWERNYKFSTYAIWWIKQAIQREIFKKSETIRVPCKLRQDVINYRKAKADLISSSKKTLTKEEIEKKLNLKKKEILAIEKAERKIISLESEFGKKEKGEKNADILIDFLPSEKGDPVYSVVEKKMMRENIQEIFSNCLKEREQMIIKMRFGLFEIDRKHTLQEVGDKLGITRERVRQIQDKVLERLKKKFKDKDFQIYLS
jgi:RNA polymerase primary sigma factor